MQTKITAGYYQPSFNLRYDEKSSIWFVDNKPTSHICLADYPCYTLGDDFSELGSHCVVIGDENYQHKAECAAIEGIVFDEAINDGKKKNTAQTVLSSLFFVYADNAFYFVINIGNITRVLPYSINAYQLSLYGKEIQVYIDLDDTKGIYRTNIVIFTNNQEARFLRKAQDDLISASTILKTGGLTRRTPAIQDGFEAIDQSESILAGSGASVALNHNQAKIEDIKKLVISALDALPDKGIVTNNNAPLDVNILPPIGSRGEPVDLDNPAILKCKGCSVNAHWIPAYTMGALPTGMTGYAYYDIYEVIYFTALVASAQCSTEEMTPQAFEKLFKLLFHNEPASVPDRKKELEGILKEDYLFPDAIQFFRLYHYNIQSVVGTNLDNIFKCNFADDAFKILAKTLNSSYSLTTVKSFLRKRSVYRSGQRKLPSSIPFGLGERELNAVKISFAQAGLLQGAKQPSFLTYKCLDILLNGPTLFNYISSGYYEYADTRVTTKYLEARLREQAAIREDDALFEKKKLLDGVDYAKDDFTFGKESDMPTGSRTVFEVLYHNKNFGNLDEMLPYKYSILSKLYKNSDIFDFLLIIAGLSPIVPSLKHTYRELDIIAEAADDEERRKALYGLLLLISLWQRLSLGTIDTNPDPACKFSFANTTKSPELYYNVMPRLRVFPAQIDGLAFGWYKQQEDYGWSEDIYSYTYKGTDQNTSNSVQGDYIFNKLEDVSINQPENAQTLSMEHYTYAEVPQKVIKSFYFNTYHEGEYKKVESNPRKMAESLVNAMSIFPNHLVLPAYVNRGTTKTKFEDIFAISPKEGLQEVYTAALADDTQFFKDLVQDKNKLQPLSAATSFNINPFSAAQFCLGDFGKTIVPLLSDASEKNVTVEGITHIIANVYSSGLYVNEHINAAIVLSDNSKDTAFVNQYAKALKAFCDMTGSLLSKVTDVTQMGVVLQSLVGFLQTNLSEFSYQGLLQLLDNTPDIQEAVANYLDLIAHKYPEISGDAYKYKFMISELNVSLVVQEEDLETIIQRCGEYSFALNTLYADAAESVATVDRAMHNNENIRSLLPRFMQIQKFEEELATRQKEEQENNILDDAIQGTQEAQPEQSALDGIVQEAQPEQNALDDIIQHDLIDGFATESADVDALDDILDDLPTPSASNSDFTTEAIDANEALDDILDDLPAEDKGTQAENTETETVEPDDNTEPSGVTLNLDTPAFTGQVISPVQDVPAEAQDASAEAQDTPVEAPDTSQAALSGNLDTSIFTNTAEPVIPPIVKPKFIIPDNTTTPIVDSNNSTNTVILSPTEDKTESQPASAPASTPSTNPVIFAPPSTGTTTEPSKMISAQQAKFNRPLKTGNPVIFTTTQIEAKPADTDELLYSSSVTAPIILEAKNANKTLARCNIVVTPEREGFARTEYITPTIHALLEYCDRTGAICYNNADNELYLIKGNAKMSVCLLHRHADKVLKAIDKGRFSLKIYPLPKLMLGYLV